MYFCGVTSLVAFDTNTLEAVRHLQHLRLTHFRRDFGSKKTYPRGGTPLLTPL